MKKKARRPAFRHRSWLPKLRLIGLVLALGLVAAGAFTFMQSDFFSIRYLDCQVDHQPCLPTQEDLFLEFLGKNIFTLKGSDRISKIKEQIYLYEDITLQKKLPNRITINLTRRQAVGLITSLGKPSLSFDREGVLFSPNDQELNSPLVQVYPEFPLQLGVKAPELAKLAELFTLLSDQQVRLSDYILDDRGVIKTHQTDKLGIVFDLNQDLAKQVASLQLILSRSKIEGKSISSIDLRFDKPVVVFGP